MPWVDTDTNTTYTVGDGGLTTNDFTNADHTKLDGIATGATADQTKADIDALNIDADTLDGQHGHTMLRQRLFQQTLVTYLIMILI